MRITAVSAEQLVDGWSRGTVTIDKEFTWAPRTDVMTHRDVVRAGYDALGETYAAERSPDGIELALLQRLVEGTGSAATVLDAGCGPGPALAALPGDVRAVGIDFSTEQLALAADRAPDADLITGELAALPFGDNRFDGVVSLGALMHVPNADQSAVLDEFARVLRAGGRVLVSDGGAEWAGENPNWLDAGVRMSWEITGIDAVAEGLAARGFERLAREDSPDELAEENEGNSPLVLAKLPA